MVSEVVTHRKERSMGLGSRAWQRNQHSETGALHCPNTEVFWQTNTHYLTMWCIDLWSWCSSSARRSTHCVCQQKIDKGRRRIRTDRTGAFGDCVRMQQIQPIRIWSRVCGPIRSSAPLDDCKKKPFWCAQTATAYASATAAIWHANRIFAGKVNARCGHPIESPCSRGLQRPGRACGERTRGSGHRNSSRRNIRFNSWWSKNANEHWPSNAEADGCRQERLAGPAKSNWQRSATLFSS